MCFFMASALQKWPNFLNGHEMANLAKSSLGDDHLRYTTNVW